MLGTQTTSIRMDSHQHLKFDDDLKDIQESLSRNWCSKRFDSPEKKAACRATSGEYTRRARNIVVVD